MARIHIKGREDGGTQEYDIELNLRDDTLELTIDGKSIASLIKKLENMSAHRQDVSDALRELQNAIYVLEELDELLRE